MKVLQKNHRLFRAIFCFGDDPERLEAARKLLAVPDGFGNVASDVALADDKEANSLETLDVPDESI